MKQITQKGEAKTEGKDQDTSEDEDDEDEGPDIDEKRLESGFKEIWIS